MIETKQLKKLETVRDLGLLIENEDLVELKGFGKMVHMGESQQELKLLGMTSIDIDTPIGVLMTIPLKKIKITNGKILPKKYIHDFFYVDKFPKYKNLLTKTGILI